MLELRTDGETSPTLNHWFGSVSFFLFLVLLGIIIYFDDLQITRTAMQEIPTIYNTRLLGVKIIDMLSLGMFSLLALNLVLKQAIRIGPFHNAMGVIVLIYCYAAAVGFIYSFVFRYDYVIWLQDFQQTIYMSGFFLLTYYLLDARRKWAAFVVCLLVFMALKNILILYWSLTGVGKLIGDWAVRASQNSEFAYFPMMFFPLLILFLQPTEKTPRLLVGLVLLVYLFNSLLGIYRTVWVMLIVGTIYLFFHLDRVSRIKLALMAAGGLSFVLVVISIFFPRFLALAWNFKFASIFDWSVSGDRSNATRILEFINVTHRVMSNFAFLQGMGLGAWWDDSARRLLPDLGSGFTYKTRFTTTHMWYVTQLLKLGFLGTIVYWGCIYKMFRRTREHLRSMAAHRWERKVLLGLNIGLLCAFLSSADFVRLFIMIGINIGLTARWITLDTEERALRTGDSATA